MSVINMAVWREGMSAVLFLSVFTLLNFNYHNHQDVYK